MALLTVTELADSTQRTIRPASGAVAIRVAEGWLRSVARIDPWPDQEIGNVPEDLFAWAVELAAIAYDNPSGLASRTVGDTARAWQLTRRAEILAAAKTAYPGASGSSGGPVGSFPASVPLPDPPAVAVTQTAASTWPY